MKNSSTIGMPKNQRAKQTKIPQKEVMGIYGLSRSGLRGMTERLGLTRYYLGRKLYYDLEEIESAMIADNTLGQKKGGDKV